MSSSSPDVAVKLNTMNRQLSVKNKEYLVYLAEILIDGASRDKSLLVLLADLGVKFEKEECPDILSNLLELAGLNKQADFLRHLNHIRPPKLLEECKYVTKEDCKLVSMRSFLIKLVSSLSKDSLRTLLEFLCLKSESNPQNYTCILVLFRELERRAFISTGRLEFIYKVLESDDQFTNVRYILDDYQKQFCNEGQRRSSAGNNPVHVGMSCPPSNQIPNGPGPYSLRGPYDPPPPTLAQQPPIVPRGVHSHHHQMRGGLIQRQISAPTNNPQNPQNPQYPPHPSNRLHQSDSFQRPMDWSPDLQRNQSVRPFRENQRPHFDPQTNQYPQQPDQHFQSPYQYPPNQYPPATHQSNQYYRQQSDQSYRPPNQQRDPNYHPQPAQPYDQNLFSSHPSFSSSSQDGQYYTRPVLPQDQRPPPLLPPSQQTGDSLSTRWLQQEGTMVGMSSQQQQQEVINQPMNVPPPLPSPYSSSGQMSYTDNNGAGGQLNSTDSWPNQPAGPTVQFYDHSSSAVGAYKPAIRSRQNSEPAGHSPSKRNPPPKKSNTLPEKSSLNSWTAANPQTSSSIQQHIQISHSNSDPPAAPAGSLVISRHQNLSPNSPGHSVNVSVSRRTPSPAAQAASFTSNVSSIPYDVEAFQVQEMRMKNEEHM